MVAAHASRVRHRTRLTGRLVRRPPAELAAQQVFRRSAGMCPEYELPVQCTFLASGPDECADFVLTWRPGVANRRRSDLRIPSRKRTGPALPCGLAGRASPDRREPALSFAHFGIAPTTTRRQQALIMVGASSKWRRGGAVHDARWFHRSSDDPALFYAEPTSPNGVPGPRLVRVALMRRLAAMDAAVDRRWNSALGGAHRSRLMTLLIMQVVALIALFLGAGLDNAMVMGIATPAVLWTIVELVRLLPEKERGDIT
jgi:hypothetical protein